MKFAGWGDPAKSFALEGKPDLWPFIHRVSGVADRAPKPPVEFDSIALPEPRIDGSFLSALKERLRDDQIASDRTTRLSHCYGKSYRDLLRAIAGQVERAPDLVLFPESHEEVEAIVAAAATSGVKLIAFGGGTNIVGGVEVTPATRGTVATVSLRRMNRVLKIDESSLVATMEAGLLGPELEAALNAAGYSLGHFPDSFEYSTLGGWLATRSAGMQSDRWGKIEDMVVSLTMVSPSGTLRSPRVPKAATGPDLNQLVVGSEGILGLITEATMKIHPLEGREYRSLLVPDFASGVALIRRCLREDCLPSTMRLSCPEETQLGIAMKPRPSPAKAILQGLGKAWLRAAKGIRMEKACAIIVGFEGDRKRIAAQRKRVLALTREHGGIDLGTSAGDRWYAGKYDYPYLRDALMVRGGMVDVTETSALWGEILPLYETMKRTLHDHLRRGEYPGYVGCHLSHSYAAGACLYFTFASEREQGNELNQYLAAKRTTVEVLLASGAALSHHHAIGYEHLPWIEQALGETGLRALRGLKDALDPDHLCNPGKLIPGPDSSLDHYWPDLTLTKLPNQES
jgi:alkyldihydroxyacetonephosphate synthase